MHKKTKKSSKKMSNGGNICEVRSWMYARKDFAGVVRNEFLNGA